MNDIIKGMSVDEIEQVRSATEHLLDREGFRVAHAGLRRLCRKAGARVDDARETVQLPPELLRQLLSQVPESFDMIHASGRRTQVGGQTQHGMAIVTDPWIVDYTTQRPRRPVLDDVRRHTVIAQRLDCIQSSSRMDFPVADVAGPTSSLEAFETYFLHQNKHVLVYVTSMQQYQQYRDIGSILLDGRDVAGSGLMTVAVALLTPLALTDLNAELLLAACRDGFAIVPTSCPIAGTTSPYTLAGTLLMGNVENVFVAALSQIVKPGNPFLYAHGPSRSDMQSGHDQYYTLDKVLWKLGAVQLARSYGLPVAAECGGAMTHRYDQQSGAEGVLFMAAAASSGAHLLAGFGSCYNAVGMSAEMMLIQTSWLHAARFLQQGIRFDGGRLGAENIAAIGPGGSYLVDDLTLMHLRDDEFFHDELFDFGGETGDGRPLVARAHDRVEELTADPRCPHPEPIQAALRTYFDRQRAALA